MGKYELVQRVIGLTAMRGLRKKVFDERGAKCQGCGGNRRREHLGLFVIDTDQKPEGKNLILLDVDCANNIRSCMRILHPDSKEEIHKTKKKLKGDISGLGPDIYDPRAGEGTL